MTTTTLLEFERIETGLSPADGRIPDDGDDELVARLASSILEIGLLQPLVVRQIRSSEPDIRAGKPKFTYHLVAGRRRHLALSLIRAQDASAFDKVPVTVWKGNATDAAMASLAENLERKSLSDAELAKAFVGLQRIGLTQEVIAERFGRTPGWVGMRVRMWERTTDAVQRALHRGKITLSEALALARLPEEGQQTHLDALIREREKKGGARPEPVLEPPSEWHDDADGTEGEIPREMPSKARAAEDDFGGACGDEVQKPVDSALVPEPTAREKLDRETGRHTKPGTKRLKAIVSGLTAKLDVMSDTRSGEYRFLDGARLGLSLALGDMTLEDAVSELGLESKE